MSATTAKQRANAKRARRPIYMVCERVAVLSTGEERLGWLAAHPIDRHLSKERGWREGDEARVTLEEARIAWQHRLLHKIGALLVENVDGYEHENGHSAIKRAQVAADVCCEFIEMSAAPVIDAILAACEELLGAGARKVLSAVLPEIKTIPVRVARSLAFDRMDQDEFERLFVGVTQWIGDTHAHVMLDEVRAEFWQMANREPQK